MREQRLFLLAFSFLLLLDLAPRLEAQAVGQRIRAASNGANVRGATLSTVLFTQDGGVHGTIAGGPILGTAGGFTGNWWQIRWDSQPPNQGSVLGWSAQSVIFPAPSAGDIPQPNFSTSYYRGDNRFWQGGFAPSSTDPPSRRLGDALGNCTWYAHGRLRELGYNPTQLDTMLHDAGTWDDFARSAGIPIDNNPTVGSIAQTDAGQSGAGHVAVVESVNADGTITISESSYYTFPDGDPRNLSSTWNFLWRHRTVSPSWFQRFIHVSPAGSNTTSNTSISLGSGWNLISLPLAPSNNAIATVVSGISGKYDSIWSYDSVFGFRVYRPGSSLSDLSTLEAGRGYWIMMNSSATLTVSGTTPSKSINLVSGLNLVGYNSLSSRLVSDAVASLGSKLLLVAALNNNTGTFNFYVPSRPALSDSFFLEPGKGYYIGVTEAVTWTLP